MQVTLLPMQVDMEDDRLTVLTHCLHGALWSSFQAYSSTLGWCNYMSNPVSYMLPQQIYWLTELKFNGKFFFGLTMSHLGKRQVSMRLPRKIHPIVATTSAHRNDPKYFSPAPASWNIFLYCSLPLWLSFLHFHFPSSKGVTRTQVDSLLVYFFGFSATASHIPII